jgi:hypothetical protein
MASRRLVCQKPVDSKKVLVSKTGSWLAKLQQYYLSVHLHCPLHVLHVHLLHLHHHPRHPVIHVLSSLSLLLLMHSWTCHPCHHGHIALVLVVVHVHPHPCRAHCVACTSTSIGATKISNKSKIYIYSPPGSLAASPLYLWPGVSMIEIKMKVTCIN